MDYSNFALISSKQLDAILSGKNKLELEKLVLCVISNHFCHCSCCWYLLDDIDFEECFYLLHKLIHFYPRYFRYFPFMCNLPILGNNCISYNAYDFSDKYLRGLIGELIYAKNLPYNKPAFQFLQDLLHVIRKKAERKNLKDILQFVSSFYRYGYGNYRYGYGNEGGEGFGEMNYEGGGIGIIYTTINLGEGE